ncbi:MAG: diaminopimelate epimerase [Acidimicrobiales bacterium]
MALRPLQKWHGAGNDFLVDVLEPGAGTWWNAQRARRVCDRARGVGADGLLIAEMDEPVTMVLYNADGTLAEMSGNGIRCLAAAVRRSTGADWEQLEISTDAGTRLVSLAMNGTSGYGSVAMGDVTFLETLAGTLGVVNVGNPHVVVRDDPSWDRAHCEDVATPLAQQLGGANVEFVTVLDEGRARLRVIERGVGWTLACGTGSVAAAAVLHREGLVRPEVTIENPGGDLMVKFDDDGARLAGPVQFVADVEWLDA